ncbi:MAG: peptidylprolyl isomerase [Cyanobacteriota bacterium]
MLKRWLFRGLLGLLVLAGPLVLTACSAEKAPQALGCGSQGQPACLQGQALIRLDTSRGAVELRLDGDAAPLTAGNFLDLVRRGVYNGTAFHRVVREPVPFVVQGGDPTSVDPSVPPTAYGQGDFIDPATARPRRIPLELKLRQESKPRYGQILSSPSQGRQLQLPHDRGAVAMARSQDPDSASAQFYIALQALLELDGRYAVFGRVVKGMEVVDRIQQGDRLLKATVLEGPGAGAPQP